MISISYRTPGYAKKDPQPYEVSVIIGVPKLDYMRQPFLQDFQKIQAPGTGEMAEYIPPHVRGDSTPAKSKNSFLEIFEPREDIDSQNITVRRSSIMNNIVTDKAGEEERVLPNSDTDQIATKCDPINPQLLAMLQSIDSKLENQGATLNKLTVSQNVMQKSIDFGHANSSDLKDRIVTLEKENQKLSTQNKELKSQVRDMTRRLDNIDQQLAQMDHNNRRRNVLIDGVKESDGENTIDIALDILSAIDQNMSRSDIDFTQRVFRHGNKTRPILVVFKSIAQRDSIMGRKKALRSRPNLSAVWLNEDSNPMIRKQKLETRSVVKHAIARGYDAKQRGLGVVINGRYYARDNMGQLPDDIQLRTTKTRIEGNTIGFQGKLAPLSNMYLCPIVVDGKDHKSAEHYIQYTKVMLANLTELAQKIQDTSCSYVAKSLGGSVKIPIWDNVGEDIVKMGMRYKYDQNPHLKKILMDTGNKTILECTPDMKWGAAISLDSKVFGTGKYPGQNVTGHSLQELRVEYRDMEATGKVTPLPMQAAGSRAQSTGTADPAGTTHTTEVNPNTVHVLGSQNTPADMNTDIPNQGNTSTQRDLVKNMQGEPGS